MVTILDVGFYIHKCKECGCEFKFERSDMTPNCAGASCKFYTINCPRCGREILYKYNDKLRRFEEC